MISNKIELLAPAGSPACLDAAIGEGADAVYLGLKDFNARQRAKNFSYREIEAIIDKLHKINKKVYIALNTIFEDWESDRIYNTLKYLNGIKPDGVIIQDFGVLNIINTYFKDLKIHASTQMNVSSAKGVNFLSKKKVNRVVLSRELSFEEIKKIRNNTSVELEIFVHGALCISCSGLCVFSSYVNRKSANRGYCSQVCRRFYNNGQKEYHFFSPSDLMLIEFIPDIIETGINSIKIEGRMRSADYVGQVVRAYRYVIDNYQNNKDDAVKKGIEILSEDLARDKTKYLFIDKKNHDFLMTDQHAGIGLYLGRIKNFELIDNKKYAVINSIENISVNDFVRVQSKDDKFRKSFKVEKVFKKNDALFILMNEKAEINDDVFLINKSETRMKYSHVIPKTLAKYKKHPGITNAPLLNHDKGNLKKMSDGFYVKINHFKDIFIAQSVKYEKLILLLNKNNVNELIKNLNNSQINSKDIIFYLEPYFNEDNDVYLKKEIDKLLSCGFTEFIINNIGHFNLFKKEDLTLIAGPFLYAFNRFSTDFLINNQIDYIISPIENSKKNVLSAYSDFNKKRFFISVFSYPELFYIKSDIASRYNFNKFTDNFENNFYLTHDDFKSAVIPEKPFAIVESIGFLKKNGFNKFIVDFSNINLKKNFYKHIMNKIFRLESIDGSDKFNWKDGFYRVK